MADNNPKVPNKETDEKDLPSKEEIRDAKILIKQLVKNMGKNLYASQSVDPAFQTISKIADKFIFLNPQGIDQVAYGTFLFSGILSGASAEFAEAYFNKKNKALWLDLQRKLHQEFDNFTISEKKHRNPEDLIKNERTMCESMSFYLEAKSRFFAKLVGSGFLIGSTLISGGVANLPIIGTAMAFSATYSLAINLWSNKKKIASKNKMALQGSHIDAQNRNMYANSQNRALYDTQNVSYKHLKDLQKTYFGEFNRFTNILYKYACSGTIVKTAITLAALATTYATSPANMVVVTAATFMSYGTICDTVNAYFSQKEHLGCFANAYKNFKSKIHNIRFGKQKIKSSDNTIQLDHVRFSHRNHQDINKRLPQTLFESDKVFYFGKGISLLSGSSGAGKSSLVDLLLHSDDITGGAIRIGSMDKKGHFKGIDYRDCAFGEQTKHIAAALQDNLQDEMSVRDYIRLSNSNPSPELIRNVEKLLDITDDPSVTGAISPDALIGPNGPNLSGGQMKRITLAQALIKDSPILILDEPTANVDPARSAKIVDYINSIKDKKTIIYISHEDDIQGLQAYQALDISKEEGNNTATISRYDLSDDKTRDTYLDMIKNRDADSSAQEKGAEKEKEKEKGQEKGAERKKYCAEEHINNLRNRIHDKNDTEKYSKSNDNDNTIPYAQNISLSDKDFACFSKFSEHHY